MIELETTTADEIVLAFLRAEIDSPDWGARYQEFLRRENLDRSTLIEHADLSDSETSNSRERLLNFVRGYGDRKYLFGLHPVPKTPS
jgi:hypothetical protein